MTNKKNKIINKIIEIYDLLQERYGHQGWWPLLSISGEEGADEKGYHRGNYEYPKEEKQQLEIIFGAILTQNTSWKNAQKALLTLHAQDLIDCKRILSVDIEKLASHIRSAGYHHQKAERLHIIAAFFLAHPFLFSMPLFECRKTLLAVKGIGPETADSILLYAAKKPIFVIDAYTKRIFSRVGLCEKDISYDALQALCMQNLPENTELFNNYHALLVELAKNHCQKTPLCASCPLRHICEHKI